MRVINDFNAKWNFTRDNSQSNQHQSIVLTKPTTNYCKRVKLTCTGKEEWTYPVPIVVYEPTMIHHLYSLPFWNKKHHQNPELAKQYKDSHREWNQM